MGTGAQTGLIDVWGQPSLGRLGALVPEVADLLRRSGSSGVLSRDVPAVELVAAMDAAGVERMILSAWSRPGQSIVSNSELYVYIKDQPGRLYGMAAVDLARPAQAVRELDQAVREYGFVALRVIPWLWKLPPNHRLYYPLYSRCVELGIPFCTQIGQTGPLMPSDTGRPVPYLDEVLLDFPELTVVGGHLGYPWVDETIGLLMKHENFYIDTSAHLPRTYPQALLDYMKTWGRRKVMYATNYPHLDIQKCADQARGLGLSPKSERAFLRENALRVFRL